MIRSLRDRCLEEIDHLLTGHVATAIGEGALDLPPRYARRTAMRLYWWLRGKRTPDAVRRHPLIRGVMAWGRAMDGTCWDMDCYRDDHQDTLMFGFLAQAQAIRDLLEMEMPATDQRYQTMGQLGLERRGGGQSIVTVTLPDSAMPQLEVLLQAVHAERRPLTLDDVRQACWESDAVLRAAHAVRLWVYGSVATGTATSASDVDLLVELDTQRQVWPSVSEVQQALEDRLEHLVDAFPGGADAATANGAVLVWEAVAKPWAEMTERERLLASQDAEIEALAGGQGR